MMLSGANGIFRSGTIFEIIRAIYDTVSINVIMLMGGLTVVVVVFTSAVICMPTIGVGMPGMRKNRNTYS